MRGIEFKMLEYSGMQTTIWSYNIVELLAAVAQQFIGCSFGFFHN